MKIARMILCAGAVMQMTGAMKAEDLASHDLTALSLEDLMRLEVTSVSRSPEKLSSVSAAVTVLTGDDIRRSGAMSIPEALRLVPGLDVAQQNAHDWAISARGFNDSFANKLLVMIDGRSVYTPLFSGVFWDVQDTLLEDIDRIEVVRGPGATLWGANAVNGVINIITKSAKDTQGFLISGGGGTEALGFGNVRYGVKVNDETFLRLYAKYLNHDSFNLSSGADGNDASEMARGGFRLDWQPTDVNALTFQGDIYSGRVDQTYFVPAATPPFFNIVAGDDEVSGGNVLGRWTRTISDTSQLSLQTYFDETERQTGVFREGRDTEDIDFQHSFALLERHKVVWGTGFRRTSDRTEGSANVTLIPSHRASELFSAFIQDEIDLIEDRLSFTLGTKLEHNDFTGFELQPSARLAWRPEERQTVWTSVSRAVRTPSRAEDDVRATIPLGTPIPLSLLGSRDFDSEKLIAYELGYRVQPVSRLSLDLTAFYNDYSDLRSAEPLIPTGLTVVGANGLEGETYGFETALTLQATEQWRLSGGYTYLQMQLHRKGSVDFATEAGTEKASPHHQFFLRSSFDFGRHFEFDSTLRYVDDIVLSGTAIPSYWTVDLRLAWKPCANWELAIVGQNLLDNQHLEFTPTLIATQPTEIQRSVYAKVTWRF